MIAAVTLSVFWVGYFFDTISESPVGLRVDSSGSKAGDVSGSRRSTPGRPIKVTAPVRHRRGFTPPVGSSWPPSTPITTPPADDDQPPAEDSSSTVIQPHEPCSPADTLDRRRSGTDGRWFNYGHRPFIQFFVFSAIWDDRASTGAGRPLVRVLAVATSVTAAVMTVDAVPLEYGVYCRFHLPDGRWLPLVSALPMALPIGYGWWLNNRLIREFIFDCPPPNGQVRPDAVTMLIGGGVNLTASVVVDPQTTACVPIEFPTKPTVKADFAVCVQARIDPRSIFSRATLR